MFVVVAGFVLLGAAVTASTAALSGPRTERAAPNRPVTHTIAGAEALRPDLINASVEFPPLAAPPPATDPRGQGPARVDASQAAQTPENDLQSEPGVDPDRGDPQPPSTGALGPPITADQDPVGGALDLGREDPILSTATAFYGTVVADPRQAFSLLDQQMRGSGYEEFRQAWAGVERVGVDHIRRDGPNAVLVTASLERKDGSVLHTLQRLVITPGVQPQITGARLLSAARS